MAWLEKLKLNKRLIPSLTRTGFLNPKEIQLRTLLRISGGQDIIAIGPEGCGKTSAYVLAVLNRLNHTPDGIPHVLILVPDKDHVLEVISRFNLLNNNKAVSVVGLYAAPGTEAQMNALADGADVVVATPDRARAIYLKLGLNLNKTDLLILDDAELIVKQGLQLPVAELANSIPKCQHLVFTTVMHDKLDKMISPFMKQPAIVEVEEISRARLEMYPQVLYQVPNFGTKLNLLNLFMQDEELFTKTLVFVNNRKTAETVYKSLQNRLKNTVTLLKPWSSGMTGFETIDDFKRSEQARLLIIVNADHEITQLDEIPFLIHFELPADKETLINRMIPARPETSEETLAITFSTDLELSEIKKIEQACGRKMQLAGLPEELLIEKERKNSAEKQTVKKKNSETAAGAAFHEKKISNSKTYNYGGGLKAKMTNKKKH